MKNTAEPKAQEISFGDIPFEDQIELSQNLQKAGAIWLEVITMMQQKRQTPSFGDPTNAMKTMVEYWSEFWKHPDEMFAKQIEFLNGVQSIWAQAFINPTEAEAPARANRHRLYQGEEWQRDAVSRYLSSVYAFMHEWVDDVSNSIDTDIDQKKHSAALSGRATVESLSPANFAWSNPKVIEATVREKGENLVRGMMMMREDVKRGKGELLIRQTDITAFKVGENVAVTEGSVIFENEQFQIIQYAPKTKTVRTKPIVIVPPWINKYYILDLNPEKSYAKWIVEQGFTVFMVSWFNADSSAGHLDWNDRVEAVSGAIDVALKETNADQAHMISFCIGGTLVGTLLAKLAKAGDQRVASTTFLTAQFDFEHAGELLAFVTDEAVATLDQYDAQGYIPATAMSHAFNLLRSSDLIWNYVVNNYLLGKTPPAFDLLYWNSDSMNMPTKIQKFYLKEFYLNNAFMNNNLPLDGGRVGAEDITHPTYHLAAIDDHIAPAESVYIAAQAMKNAPVRYVMSGSGHIAGVVNPPEKVKYQYWTNEDLTPSFSDWHAAAKSTPGSWWLDWIEWLNAFDDTEIAAREVGSVHGRIEPAPGRYVMRRFEEVA